MKKVELANGIYNIYRIETVKDANDNDVSVKVLENSLTLEQVNYHKDQAQEALNVWLDVVSQIEILDA